jgi:hypothetical protein
MSKKKLLEESTIRSFMKLANLQPLTNKFLKESEQLEEEELEESSHKGEKEEEKEEELKEEMSEEDGEVKEEAKTLTPQKPGKMDAAKHAAPDAKMKPLKAGTHHSDKPDSIETKGHSNAPKKNNSQHDVVSENLEEMEMEADEMTGSDAAGESEEHQESVKDAIQKILGAVSQIAQEYGVEMDVQSGEEDMEPEAPPADMAPEAPPAEDDKMMEAKLDEMVEKLTKRVAARLVKESKKKR